MENAASVIPPGTRINVTFLENEDAGGVPHGAPRRRSDGERFSVGGYPAVPIGPYEDSLTVIESGVLQQYGVKHVSIGGYPDGHPDISGDVLWPALEKKAAALSRLAIPGSVITQVDFDVDRVLSWVAEVRDHGVDLPIRVGVPGPASVKLLLGFVGRLGISTSATSPGIRPVGHQPPRQGRPGEFHPRPGREAGPGKARRGAGARPTCRIFQNLFGAG